MGKLNLTGYLECEVGGVYHVCYFNQPEIDAILKRNGKDHGSINGQIFPYIAHYLVTGDLVYPAHEGENHVSSLLEDMRRLDLLQRLFPKQMNAKGSCDDTHRTSGKVSRESPEGNSTPLRIRTKETRWVTRTLSRVLRISKSSDIKSAKVYRPPPQQNKGTTLVVLRSLLQGQTRLRIHGPPAALQSVLPDSQHVQSQHSHHHLSSHLELAGESAHSLIMSLEDGGFVVTVRSSRVEGDTGAVITQWLLYRRPGKRFSSTGGSVPRSSSLGKALSTSKKVSQSMSTSRKKTSKNSSATHHKKHFPFASDLAKNQENQKNLRSPNNPVPGMVESQVHISSQHSIKTTGIEQCQKCPSSRSSESFQEPKSSLFRSRISPSHSTSLSSSPSSSISSSPSSNSSKRSSSISGSSSQSSLAQKRSLSKLMLEGRPSNKLPDKTTPVRETPFKGNPTKESSGGLTLSHRSYSSSSIGVTKCDKKLRKFPSLWDVCSKASVKKVFTILF